MTRFVQICASQNDLFALDAEGDIHQYHFDVKTWVKLSANREESKEGVPAGVAWRHNRSGSAPSPDLRRSVPTESE
jgi:hypothetical protein